MGEGGREEGKESHAGLGRVLWCGKAQEVIPVGAGVRDVESDPLPQGLPHCVLRRESTTLQRKERTVGVPALSSGELERDCRGKGAAPQCLFLEGVAWPWEGFFLSRDYD